jgi:uncharacterized membrane protein
MSLLALLAATNNAAMDWLLVAAACIVFVAIIAGAAEGLNRRDRARAQREAQNAPLAAQQHH